MRSRCCRSSFPPLTLLNPHRKEISSRCKTWRLEPYNLCCFCLVSVVPVLFPRCFRPALVLQPLPCPGMVRADLPADPSVRLFSFPVLFRVVSTSWLTAPHFLIFSPSFASRTPNEPRSPTFSSSATSLILSFNCGGCPFSMRAFQHLFAFSPCKTVTTVVTANCSFNSRSKFRMRIYVYLISS